jgi:hypothetical protein
MERGLYEQLVTEDLQRRLATIADDEVRTRPVDTGDQPHVLARHIETAVHKALAATGDPERRLAIVNALLSTLAWRSVPFLTSRPCWTCSTSNVAFTTAIAT